jgi:hypothetical protein
MTLTGKGSVGFVSKAAEAHNRRACGGRTPRTLSSETVGETTHIAACAIARVCARKVASNLSVATLHSYNPSNAKPALYISQCSISARTSSLDAVIILPFPPQNPEETANLQRKGETPTSKNHTTGATWRKLQLPLRVSLSSAFQSSTRRPPIWCVGL